jgi:beta-glucanase (GH16 family)
MRIEVSKPHLPPLDSCSHASVEEIPFKPLMSGEMRSRYNLFRYGRYEARIKAPEIQRGKPWVNGNFISTVFAYRDANAHHWREIDFEITANAPNSLTTNLLYADGTKNWKPYLQDSRQPRLGNVNLREEFHTYAFEWTPKGVVWFVDGKEVRRGSHLKVPELSTKIMMNLWIFTGGAFGGPQIHNNDYPFHSEYEYFRFYKWNGDDKYPCSDMTSSCLTADDMYLTGNNPCDGIAQEGLLEGQRVCTAKCRGAAAASWGYK